MKGISQQTVLQVAKLARLELAPEELGPLALELGRVLEYVSQLSEVSVDGVEPTASIAVRGAPLREDVVEPSLAPDVALAEAPRRSDGGFAVVGFVDES